MRNNTIHLSRACMLQPASSFNLKARDVDVAGGWNGTALLNARCTSRPRTCALPVGRNADGRSNGLLRERVGSRFFEVPSKEHTAWSKR